MPVPFIMPKFDMDQEKATIISWSKKEGDVVKSDETILTVETEKVAIDVPCPASGTLAGILYKDGDVVPVTEVIAYILKQGETLADLPKAGLPTPPSKPEPFDGAQGRAVLTQACRCPSSLLPSAPRLWRFAWQKKKALTCRKSRRRVTRSQKKMWNDLLKIKSQPDV